MEKFLKQNPKSRLFVEGQVELGDLYFVLKDYSKALERYEWTIQNYPHHPLVKRAYLGMEALSPISHHSRMYRGVTRETSLCRVTYRRRSDALPFKHHKATSKSYNHDQSKESFHHAPPIDTRPS